MKFEYDFPVIEHINDLLPAIEGCDEFVVAEKDGYTVVNYNVNFEDTFPPVHVAGGSAKMRAERSRMNALRRECRGIIFNSETGEIIRRPYHKFFNVNERDETLQRNVNLSEDHVILEKLDGSMIAPFYLDGDQRVIWGTKMGDTDVAKPVQAFVAQNPQYKRLACTMMDINFTPIFEWCSNKQRIVLDQPEDQLILTAIRNMRTGEYLSHAKIQQFAEFFDIPFVKAFNFENGMDEFVKMVHDMEDIEGFVVRFDSGHMVKLKCHWYVQIHKAKEAILQDRNIVQIILENDLDDIKANVTIEERDRLAEFETNFWCKVNASILDLYERIYNIRFKTTIDRKEFAINHAPNWNGFEKSICFKLWDNYEIEAIRHEVINTIRNNLGKTVKYEAIRDLWFEGVTYND